MLRSIQLSLFVAAIFGSVGCMGYLPGRQTYWDAKVREMCKADGGVRILERVRISEAEVRLLGQADGRIGIPVKELAPPDAPVYAVLNRALLEHVGNLGVGRTESTIIRRADGAVVARWVAYSRTGGDVPTGLAHESTYWCPELKTIASDLQQLFIVVDNPK